MFDKFGNMTAEEINKAAEGLLKEGDTKNICELAKENGLDEIYPQMYINGEIPELCDAITAAVGKLDIEMKEKEVKKYATKIPAEPIAEYLKQRVVDKPEMALLVRKPEKSLVECLKHVEKEARKVVTKDAPYLADAVVYRMAENYYRGEKNEKE